MFSFPPLQAGFTFKHKPWPCHANSCKCILCLRFQNHYLSADVEHNFTDISLVFSERWCGLLQELQPAMLTPNAFCSWGWKVKLASSSPLTPSFLLYIFYLLYFPSDQSPSQVCKVWHGCYRRWAFSVRGTSGSQENELLFAWWLQENVWV